MKELIEFVAKSLVDDVDAVHAHTFDRGDQTVIELEVAQPDLGKVIGLNQAVTVPAGSFTGCVTTEDKNELMPNEAVENKIDCPQVGLVSSVDLGDPPLELTSHTP